MFEPEFPAGPQNDDDFDREFELSVFGGPTAFTSKEEENPRTVQQQSSSATKTVPGSASTDVGGENVLTHSSEEEKASPIKDSVPTAEAIHSGNGISKHRRDVIVRTEFRVSSPHFAVESFCVCAACLAFCGFIRYINTLGIVYKTTGYKTKSFIRHIGID